MLYDWRELSKRNTKKMQDIFDAVDVAYSDRLGYGQLAYSLIKDDDFKNSSARWGAFLNALEMVVQGFNGITKPKPRQRNLDDERDGGERTGN